MTKPKHRTSQPKRGPVLSGNPLARGVVAFQTGDNVREWTKSSGSPVVANTKYGRAQTLSNESLTKEIPSRAVSNCTIASIYRPSSLSIESALGSFGGSSQAFLLYLVGGTVPYMWNANSQIGAGSVSVGVWTTLVGRSGDSLLDVWQDGKLLASTSTGGTWTVDHVAVGGYWAGGGLQGGYRAQGDTALTVVWDRTLSDAEVREFTRNPWQIFQQAPRFLDTFRLATVVNDVTQDGAPASVVIAGQSGQGNQSNSGAVASIVFTGQSGQGSITALGANGSLVFTGQAGQGIQSNTGANGTVTLTGQAGQGSITASGANGALLITGLDGNGVIGFTQSGVSASMLFAGNDGQSSIIALGANGVVTLTGQDGNGIIGYTQSGVTASILFTGNDGQGSIIALGANGVVTLTGEDGSGVVGFTQTGEPGGLVYTGQDGVGVATRQDVEYGSGPFTYPHALRKRKQEAEGQLTEQVKRTIRRIAKGVVVGKVAKEELGQIKDFASLNALRRSVEFYGAIDKSLAMRKAQDNFAAQEAVRLFIVELERRAQQIEEDDIAFLMMQVVADID